MSAVSTLNALRNVLSRWWMHDSLWLNDPDCLMVRDTDTALTPDEVRTLATVIALSGGMVLDSDNLRKLSDENRRVISMSLPVYGKCAVPFDLFTAQGTPQFFELDCRTHRMLGVFNWDEHATDVSRPYRTRRRTFSTCGRSGMLARTAGKRRSGYPPTDARS